MEELWKRFEAWLDIEAPELKGLLQAGASEDEILHAESVMNVVFPDDVRACYRIHNGQSFHYDEEVFSRCYITIGAGLKDGQRTA